jgi:SWI/SNF-related matrix-associated actin-dependent regulator of chromatin subfamily A3
MCSERVTNLMEQIQKQKVVELTPENMKALQDMLSLSIQSQEECAVCLDDLHNPVITPCAHVFGRECIERVIETQKKCPMCRAELKDNSVLVQPANDFGDEARDDSIDFDASSTKLEALIEILKASKGTGNKTVVFSQWVCDHDFSENARLLTYTVIDQVPRYRTSKTRPRWLQILQTRWHHVR